MIVLHVPGYGSLQGAYARDATRDEIQAALTALGQPRAIDWQIKARPIVEPKAAPRVAPKFMALSLADAVASARDLSDYKAVGDGRKVAPEIRRADAWLAARGWAYHAGTRQLRCLTCRRHYGPTKAGDDNCPHAA